MTRIEARSLRVASIPNVNRASLLMLALFLCLPGLLPAQNLTAKINNYMTAQVEINHFAGSILVARKGGLLVEACYGPTNLRTKGKCGAGKRYPIGSIAKQFAALAILQYWEKGKIKLGDSVCEYVATCPDAWQGITILDLLTQTDGLPEKDSPTFHTDFSRQELASADLVLLRDEPLEFTPGTQVKFGNSGYAVLSAVVERLSGESYLDYLRDYVFAPTGMRNTRPGTNREWSKPSQWVTPTDLVAVRPYTFARLDSTVDDLYRWIQSLDTDRLASKQSVEEMLSPRRDGYGFGWAILYEFGQKVETQSGGFNLLSSSIRRYPESRTCVIVLSDATNVDAEKITHDLAAILFDKHYEIPTERHGIAIDPTIYDSYAGLYKTLGLSLVVKKKQDHLVVQDVGQKEVELIPESETRFYVSGVDTEINFVRGMDGKATELILEQGDREISLLRAAVKS